MPERRGSAYVFVGSSSEGLRIAEEVHDGLEACRLEGRRLCRVTMWDEMFKPGDLVVDRLLNDSAMFDYAIIVVTPDDYTLSRGKRKESPRDNINLEIGIFIAVLGRKHCIVLRPSNLDIKMPSDLLGLCTVQYEFVSERPAAGDLRPAINKIRAHIETTGLRDLPKVFMKAWGYHHDIKSFAATLNEARIRPYGNGEHYLVLGCFHGEGGEMYETKSIALSPPWCVPRTVPREPKLTTDCSAFSDALEDGELVWGILFLVDQKFDPRKVKCLNDIVHQGGRVIDGRGNACQIPP